MVDGSPPMLSMLGLFTKTYFLDPNFIKSEKWTSEYYYARSIFPYSSYVKESLEEDKKIRRVENEDFLNPKP